MTTLLWVVAALVLVYFGVRLGFRMLFPRRWE